MWVQVLDAGNGSPINDATFGTSTGPPDVYFGGNGWYYLYQIAANAWILISDPCHASTLFGTDGLYPLTALLRKTGGWPNC